MKSTEQIKIIIILAKFIMFKPYLRLTKGECIPDPVFPLILGGNRDHLLEA